MSLYQQQREQVRKNILKTAVKVFQEKGYDNATIDEITKAVGIAKGTFYNFYPSKSEILIAWAAERFSRFDVSAAFDGGKTVEQNLVTFADILVTAIEDEAQLFRSFLKEILQVHGDQRYQSQFDFLEIYKEIIRHSTDGKIVSTSLLDVKIVVLNSVLFLGIINWFSAGNPVDGLKSHLTEIIRVCMHGLLAKEGSEKLC